MIKTRVAFVSSVDSTFVGWDFGILRERFAVRKVGWNGKRSIPNLAWSILRSDVAFSWFALDHAYGACRLAKALGRKSIVVVGGVDAAKAEDLGYGAHLDPTIARRTQYTLGHSDRVLVVDDSLRDEIARNTGIRRSEIFTVPLGFDVDFYRPGDGPRSTVLTVGYVTDVNVARKGLETFVGAARFAPELPFVLVGATPSAATDRLRNMAPPNVRLLPPMQTKDLLNEYRRARVYVQASLYEGLPSALGEAMACGCVPVGTRVAGIPTLIGDAGFYVPPRSPEALADEIRRAYESDKGTIARQRITGEFSSARRREALHRIVMELANGGHGSA